jgi:hypothetical protein
VLLHIEHFKHDVDAMNTNSDLSQDVLGLNSELNSC